MEPRPFRLSRKFEGKIAKEHASFNDKLEKKSDEDERRERREAYSTPAMRMKLAKSPVRLEMIPTQIGGQSCSLASASLFDPSDHSDHVK